MRARAWRLGLHALPLVAFLASIALRIASPPLLESVRDQAFDQYQRWQPRVRNQTVAVVDLDDESLHRLGQWPWPRTLVARLIDALHQEGASVVAFDIVFAEPDRTSPAQVLSTWDTAQISPEAVSALRALPDHDAVLAQAIASARVVTGFSLTDRANDLKPQLKAGFAFSGPMPNAFLFDYPGAVPTLPILEKEAAGNGHFNLIGEHDGVVRRVPLLLRSGDTICPSLGAEALRLDAKAGGYAVKSADTGVTHVKIGSRVVPTDANGRVWVYYAPDEASTWIPAWRVLEGTGPAGALHNAIVLVGTSASGLRDLRTTPLSPLTAGVSVHAQMIEQVLDGQFLLRPDWADGAELLYLILLGLALLILLPRLGPVWCAAFGAIAVGAAMGASWYAFSHFHWLLDAVMPSLAVLLIYLLASFAAFMRTEGERRRVRDAFGRYLSPVLVDQLARHPEQLRLGGESRMMTLLFADIRGFSRIAERMDAQALTQFMNAFLTPMTRVILENGGTVDKYIGDCIMAFWNAPLESAAHAQQACGVALAMQKELVAWNASKPEEDRVRLGIGVNTGNCCVGNIGSEQRFDYSVLGDPVNLASRLESLSRIYGVDSVVGPETAAAASALLLLELDLVTVKGKTQPVKVFALLGDADQAAKPEVAAWRAAHDRMLHAYRNKEWEEAERGCAAALAASPKDLPLAKLYALYQERIRFHREHPPGADWNGVWVSLEK